MNLFKSHFVYSKSQRNGIFVLILLVFVLQLMLSFVKIDSEKHEVTDFVTKNIQEALDSLSTIEKERKLKVFPFNPNYLSDYKAYQLGMSMSEIDKLLVYRKSGKYVNSSEDFQKVTLVSDSLLNVLSPFFKFPSWVSSKVNKVRDVNEVKDINIAAVADLTKVRGIGLKRAHRIVKYRELLGGFTFKSQLKEIWGIPSDILRLLEKEFDVLSKPKITKLDVNKVTVYELSKLVYVDYKLAKSIVAYRRENAEIQRLEELKMISGFPADRFNLISLYLQAY